MQRIEETYSCRVVEGTEVEKYLYKSEQYNAQDQLTEIMHFGLNGELLIEEHRTYENDHLILLTTIDYVHDIETKTSFLYVNNLLVEEREFFEGGSYANTSYTYNEFAKVISVLKTDENQNTLSQEHMTYEGRSTFIQFIDHDDYTFRKVENQYNELGQLISEISSEFYMVDNEEEEIQTISNYEYDDNGNQINLEINRFDQRIYTLNSEFNQQGLLIKEMTWDIENEIESVYTLSYDHNNNLVKDVLEEHGRLVSEINYFYDTGGKPFQTESTTLAVDNYYVKYRTTLVIKDIPG